MSIISGGEAYDSIIYLRTPFDTSSPSLKCALIAEAISNYSRSEFHICINNVSDNTPSSNATINDSKLSIDRDGEVNSPGSLIVNNTNIMTAITDLQNNSGSSIDNTTALEVASLKTTSASISSSSSQESVEIGKSGAAAIVRISSMQL